MRNSGGRRSPSPSPLPFKQEAADRHFNTSAHASPSVSSPRSLLNIYRRARPRVKICAGQVLLKPRLSEACRASASGDRTLRACPERCSWLEALGREAADAADDTPSWPHQERVQRHGHRSARSFTCCATLPRTPATTEQYAPSCGVPAHRAGTGAAALPAAYLKQVSTSDIVPFALTMQSPWMPVMQSPSRAPRQWLEPTPQLSTSPATTESSINEQRTVQLFDLPEMPGMGVNDAKEPPPPPYTLLQSSVGSFGSEGGITAPGWAGASQEWLWGIPV